MLALLPVNAQRIARLEREMLEEVAAAPGSSLAIVTLVNAHFRKPWVPGHRTVLLRPLTSGLDKFFKVPVDTDDGLDWYFPSSVWWMAHARASHPPRGLGCSVRVHVDFLTAGGRRGEFAYASLLKN